ncbi:MAG: ABC transporter permease [Actinomycetes bacterium]
MLKSELLKIRSLPTPRTALVFVLAAILAACVIVGLVAPEGNAVEWYHRAPDFAVNLVGTIAAMVLGAWVIGLEFSSKTVRLAATVQPARSRLIVTKFLVALGLLTAFAVAVTAVAYLAQLAMCSIGGIDFPSREALDSAVAYTLLSIFWGMFAFGLVLLLRSYTAGLIVSIVLAIGIDNALQLIPKVGKYTFGSATGSVANSITGDNEATLTIGIAVLATLTWIAVVNLAGSVRFSTTDLK